MLVLLRHRIVIAAADEALDREEGALGIGDGLALGRLADQRSPSSVNATMDGVVRAPSEFSMTFGVLPSMTRRRNSLCRGRYR
jgi:hypothetical protein